MIPTIAETAHVALSFEREGDRWFWFKLVAWAVVGWLLLLPSAWKVLLLVLSSSLKTFSFPGPGGAAISTFDLTSMLIAHVLVLWLGFYVSTYGIGAVSLPGWVSKLVGAGVLCIGLPFGGVVVALIVGLIVELIGVEQELVWLYLDSWTPFEAWRTMP